MYTCMYMGMPGMRYITNWPDRGQRGGGEGGLVRPLTGPGVGGAVVDGHDAGGRQRRGVKLAGWWWVRGARCGDGMGSIHQPRWRRMPAVCGRGGARHTHAKPHTTGAPPTCTQAFDRDSRPGACGRARPPCRRPPAPWRSAPSCRSGVGVGLWGVSMGPAQAVVRRAAVGPRRSTSA